jgi:hypothetical protein
MRNPVFERYTVSLPPERQPATHKTAGHAPKPCVRAVQALALPHLVDPHPEPPHRLLTITPGETPGRLLDPGSRLGKPELPAEQADADHDVHEPIVEKRAILATAEHVLGKVPDAVRSEERVVLQRLADQVAC